jgi:hypothetical protein
MNQADLTQMLVGKEQEAILRTLAMMAYNPAIGRVLAKGGVVKFSDLMVAEVPKLYSAVNGGTFEQWHAEACAQILEDFRTTKDQKLSYGQAQKPLNVFLKVYVDWARLPTRELADRLAPALHCPLDSVVMKFVKREFRSEYDKRIASLRRYAIDRLTERVRKLAGTSSRAVAKRFAGTEHSLAAVDKETYLEWQALFRTLWPGKPVQFDLVWALERRASSSETNSSADDDQGT